MWMKKLNKVQHIGFACFTLRTKALPFSETSPTIYQLTLQNILKRQIFCNISTKICSHFLQAADPHLIYHTYKLSKCNQLPKSIVQNIP